MPYRAPVVDREGGRFGTAESLLGDEAEDIFHGIAVKRSGDGRLVEVAAAHVQRITSREIRTDLSREDVAALPPYFAEIEEEIAILSERDEDQATRVEQTAIIVAVAVMSHVEPETRFTLRSRNGTGHDYYLNETRDEMIEIAGLWKGGLPGLFAETQAQSDLNPSLRKRWVSVTIIMKSPRNRTEGLHS